MEVKQVTATATVFLDSTEIASAMKDAVTAALVASLGPGKIKGMDLEDVMVQVEFVKEIVA